MTVYYFFRHKHLQRMTNSTFHHIYSISKYMLYSNLTYYYAFKQIDYLRHGIVISALLMFKKQLLVRRCAQEHTSENPEDSVHSYHTCTAALHGMRAS